MPPSREASQAVAGPSKPPKRLSKGSSVPARLVPRSQNAKQKAAAVQSSKELSSLEVASLEDSDDEGSRTSSPFDPETSQTRYDEAHKMLLAKIQTLNGKSRLIDGNVDGAESKAPPNAQQVTATELSAESIPSLSAFHTNSDGSGGGDSRLLPPSLPSSTNRSEALTRANNLLKERLKSKSPVKAPLQASDSISHAPRAVANELASSPEKVPPPAAPLQQPLLRWEFGLTGMEQASAAAAASASKRAGLDVPEVRYPPQRLQESSSDGQNAKATTSQEVAVSAPNGLDRQAAEKTSSASTLANVLAKLFPSKPDAPTIAPNLEGEATGLSNEHAAIAAPTVADQTIEEVLKSQRVKGASSAGGKSDALMAEVDSESGAPPQGEAEPEHASQNTSAPAAAPELDSVLTERLPTGNGRAPAPIEPTSAGHNGASDIPFHSPKESMASTSVSKSAAPPILPSDVERPQLQEAEASSPVNNAAKAPQLEVAASVNPAREENAVDAVVAPTNAFRAAEVSTPPATSDALRTLSQAWGDFDLAAFEEEDFASQPVAFGGSDNRSEEARMSESVVRDADEGLPADSEPIEVNASSSKPVRPAASDSQAHESAIEESQPNKESSHLAVEAGATASAEALEKSARVEADSMDTGADGGDNGTGKSIQDGSQPPQAIATSVSESRPPSGSTDGGEVEYADASAENAAVQKDERESSNAQNLNETNASSAIALKGQHRAPSSGLASQSLTTAPAPPDAALPSTAATREDLGFPDDSDMSVLTSKQLIGTAEPQQTDTSRPILGAANDPQNVDARDDGNIEIHDSAIDATPPKDGQSATSVRSHANAPERETRILMDESQQVMPPVVTEGMSLPFSMGPETQMQGASHSDGTQSSEAVAHEDRSEQSQSVVQSRRDSQGKAAGQKGDDYAPQSELEHRDSTANDMVSSRSNHATPERKSPTDPEADDPWYGRTPPGPRQFVSVQIDIPGPESLESPSESSDESLPPIGPGSRSRRHQIGQRTSAPSDARIKSPNAIRQATVRQTRSSKKHPGSQSAPPARRSSIHTVEPDGKSSSRQQTTLHRFLGHSGDKEERPKSKSRSNGSSHGANGSDDSSSSEQHDAAKRPTPRPMPRKRAPKQMAVESQFTQRMELRQSSEDADESGETPASAVNAPEPKANAHLETSLAKVKSPAGQAKEGVVAQSPPMSAAKVPAEVIVVDDTQSQAVAGHPSTVTNASGGDQKDTQDSEIEMIAGAGEPNKGPAVVAAESAAPPEQLLVLSGSVSTAEALRRLREEQENSKQEQQWLMDNVHPSERHDAEQAAVAARSGASCTEEEESQGPRQANPERREQAVETTAQSSSSPEPWARPRLAMMMGTAPGRDGERRVANGSSAQMRPLGQFVNELLYPQDDQSRVEGRALRQEAQPSTEAAVASNGGETPAKASALASASAPAPSNGETSSAAPGKGQTPSSAPRGTARLASVAMPRADSPSAPKRRRTGYKPMGKEEAKRRLAELTAQIVD